MNFEPYYIINMTRTIIFSIISLLFATAVIGQTPAKYWVAFTDKKGTPYSIDKP